MDCFTSMKRNERYSGPSQRRTVAEERAGPSRKNHCEGQRRRSESRRCRHLLGDVETQKAADGVLITLEKPSKQMRTEAADAGRYTSKLWHDKDYPRIQILTVEELLSCVERVDAPQINLFAMAARESSREKQTEML